MQLQDLTLEQLRERLERQLKSCAMWKQSSDGSYGLALANSGYLDTLDEITRRKATNDN